MRDIAEGNNALTHTAYGYVFFRIHFLCRSSLVDLEMFDQFDKKKKKAVAVSQIFFKSGFFMTIDIPFCGCKAETLMVIYHTVCTARQAECDVYPAVPQRKPDRLLQMHVIFLWTT